MRKDSKTKKLHGQELLDSIEEKIQEYMASPQKSPRIEDNAIKYIVRWISFQEEDKDKMIAQYFDQVKENLLQTISQYENSNTSIRSEISDDDMMEKS